MENSPHAENMEITTSFNSIKQTISADSSEDVKPNIVVGFSSLIEHDNSIVLPLKDDTSNSAIEDHMMYSAHMEEHTNSTATVNVVIEEENITIDGKVDEM